VKVITNLSAVIRTSGGFTVPVTPLLQPSRDTSAVNRVAPESSGWLGARYHVAVARSRASTLGVEVEVVDTTLVALEVSLSATVLHPAREMASREIPPAMVRLMFLGRTLASLVASRLTGKAG
jgi:hypothetical protein